MVRCFIVIPIKVTDKLTFFRVLHKNFPLIICYYNKNNYLCSVELITKYVEYEDKGI